MLKDIIKNNCTQSTRNRKTKLFAHYKSSKTSSLIMKNNLSLERGAPNRVGVSQITFREEPIKDHHQQYHNSLISKANIINNAAILFQPSNKKCLAVLETICIRDMFPAINIQMNIWTKIPLVDAIPHRHSNNRTFLASTRVSTGTIDANQPTVDSATITPTNVTTSANVQATLSAMDLAATWSTVTINASRIATAVPEHPVFSSNSSNEATSTATISPHVLQTLQVAMLYQPAAHCEYQQDCKLWRLQQKPRRDFCIGCFIY